MWSIHVLDRATVGRRVLNKTKIRALSNPDRAFPGREWGVEPASQALLPWGVYTLGHDTAESLSELKSCYKAVNAEY